LIWRQSIDRIGSLQGLRCAPLRCGNGKCIVPQASRPNNFKTGVAGGQQQWQMTGLKAIACDAILPAPQVAARDFGRRQLRQTSVFQARISPFVPVRRFPKSSIRCNRYETIDN
jgi:hypothetical protein